MKGKAEEWVKRDPTQPGLGGPGRVPWRGALKGE